MSIVSLFSLEKVKKEGLVIFLEIFLDYFEGVGLQYWQHGHGHDGRVVNMV